MSIRKPSCVGPVRALRTAAAVVVLIGFAGAAAAATVATSCPGTEATIDREFTLVTAAPGATCIAWGQGNLSGNPEADPLLVTGGALYGYSLIDKTDDSTSGLVPQLLVSSPATSRRSGTFSFSVPPQFAGYEWAIAFKSGQGQLDPDYAVFKLPPGVTSGSWTISGSQSLSHVNLYGLSPVPLPAAAWLFGTALIGLGAARRLQRQSAS